MPERAAKFLREDFFSAHRVAKSTCAAWKATALIRWLIVAVLPSIAAAEPPITDASSGVLVVTRSVVSRLRSIDPRPQSD
jgi:hypothetical protein